MWSMRVVMMDRSVIIVVVLCGIVVFDPLWGGTIPARTHHTQGFCRPTPYGTAIANSNY